MLEILAYSAIVLVGIIGAILLIASTRPDTFKVSRTKTIAAAPERLFPQIANLRQMNTWNPFALRDPASKVDYSGPESGTGSVHTFDGKQSGAGSIEVLEAHAPSNIVMRLIMTRPFKADNRVEFTLAPNGVGTTDVTWTMGGRQPLIAKAMTLFIDCDKMVGKEFETGLGNLQRLVEAT